MVIDYVHNTNTAISPHNILTLNIAHIPADRPLPLGAWTCVSLRAARRAGGGAGGAWGVCAGDVVFFVLVRLHFIKSFSLHVPYCGEAL